VSTGVYRGRAAVTRVDREFLFLRPDAFVVLDRVGTTAGARRVWTLNVPGTASIDADRYMHRFTPRKATSHWSAVNIAKVGRLDQEGRMTAAGRSAFAGHEGRRAPYSHESAPRELSPEHLDAVRAVPAAWAFYRVQPPSMKKAVANWIANAKRDATRERRLALLIACSAEGRRIPQFISPKGPSPKR